VVPRMPTNTARYSCDQIKMWPERGNQGLMPVNSREKSRHHVSQQNKRDPFENARDPAVGGPQQKGHDDEGIARRPDQRADSRDHPRRVPHTPRSAAMLITLATISRLHAPQSTHFE